MCDIYRIIWHKSIYEEQEYTLGVQSILQIYVYIEVRSKGHAGVYLVVLTFDSELLLTFMYTSSISPSIRTRVYIQRAHVQGHI